MRNNPQQESKKLKVKKKKERSERKKVVKGRDKIQQE